MSVIRQLGKAVFASADLFLPTPRGPRILIYHQVGSGLGRQMEVTVGDFIWQLDWLVQNRKVVSLDEALERWEEPGSDNLVALTFDDGYQDTYTTAFPLLKERGLPLTIYLATGWIETQDGPPRAGPLTWDEIVAMLDTGLVTIGAHTHTHADLRSLSQDEIDAEITSSNRLIESRLGVNPVHFAYPWGYWSAEADPIIRRSYASATLGAPTWHRGGGRDNFLIQRFPVQLSDGRRWFGSRLRGGLAVEEAIRRRLRGYEGEALSR